MRAVRARGLGRGFAEALSLGLAWLAAPGYAKDLPNATAAAPTTRPLFYIPCQLSSVE
jgi:hypothetical protein